MKNNVKKQKNKGLNFFQVFKRIFNELKQVRVILIAIVLTSVAGVAISLATPTLPAVFQAPTHLSPLGAC